MNLFYKKNMEQNIDIEDLKTFIDRVNRTKKYDRKEISEYYDTIFGKEDRPDSYEACPIMQMRKIKAWYQDKKQK